MLEFLYSGEINKGILENHVEEIFVLAHNYKVESLKPECEMFMSSVISKEFFEKFLGYFLGNRNCLF